MWIEGENPLDCRIFYRCIRCFRYLLWIMHMWRIEVDWLVLFPSKRLEKRSFYSIFLTLTNKLFQMIVLRFFFRLPWWEHTLIFWRERGKGERLRKQIIVSNCKNYVVFMVFHLFLASFRWKIKSLYGFSSDNFCTFHLLKRFMLEKPKKSPTIYAKIKVYELGY